MVEKTAIKKKRLQETDLRIELLSILPSSTNELNAIVYLKFWISLHAYPILITPVLPSTEERKSRAAAVST